MIPDSGPGIFLLWGAFMAALGLIAVAIFTPPDPETPSLLFGTAGVMVALVVLMVWLGVGRADRAQRRADPDISPATVWTVLSLVLLALSAELGLWLSLIAAGMIAAGIAGLVRELRSQGETLRRATDEERRS